MLEVQILNKILLNIHATIVLFLQVVIVFYNVIITLPKKFIDKNF